MQRLITTADGSAIVPPPPTYVPAHTATPVPFAWETFSAYICHLLSAWHVLRAVAGNHIVPLPLFREKSLAFTRELLIFFQTHGSDAEVGEVAGFLLQVLSEDYSTDVEDDSDWSVAQWLMEGFYRLQMGDHSLLLELQNGWPLLPGFDAPNVPLDTAASGAHQALSDRSAEKVQPPSGCAPSALCAPGGHNCCSSCEASEHSDEDEDTCGDEYCDAEVSDNLWI